MTTKISLICPTEDRPAFMPLLGNTFRSLDVPDGHELELVVVDSSDEKTQKRVYAELERYVPGSRLRYQWYPEYGCTIAEKRNLGMDLATGDYIAWIDDDDIRAPCWLRWALEELGDLDLIRVKTQVQFISIVPTPMISKYMWTQWYSLGLYGVDVAREVRFDESMAIGEDVHWHGRIMAAVPADRQRMVLGEGLGATLSHTANIANRFDKPAPWKYPVANPGRWTDEDWDKTLVWIEDLRRRLGYVG